MRHWQAGDGFVTPPCSRDSLDCRKEAAIQQRARGFDMCVIESVEMTAKAAPAMEGYPTDVFASPL